MERSKKKDNYRAAPAFNGLLSCISGEARWEVVDLNIERKVVPCPVCGKPNDINEAIKRARS